MAKSFKPQAPAPKPAVSAAPAAQPIRSTDVRNSPVPRAAAPAGGQPQRKEITHDQIARRAYEIWQSGQGGSEFDNWVRAERELRGK